MHIDQDLGENDYEELVTFPPPERKVITQPYDLSVQTLTEQWDEGVLVVPDFQRGYVWDGGRASRLIESLLLNIPIPVLYFAETPDAKYEIIDGHQRIASVARFVGNQFKLTSLRVLGEHSGLRYFELPEREQRYLKTRSMRAIIVSNDSHPLMKFEIFERLNTGSVDLTAQEIRNALYHGSLNETLKSLEINAMFRAAIGTKHPRNRMVDRELILRFLALVDSLPDYRPPLSRFLNLFMHANRNASSAILEELRSRFVNTVASVLTVTDIDAFRLFDTSGALIDKNVNRALFDAQILSFASIVEPTGPVLAEHAESVRSSLGKLHEDEQFRDSIQRATGDRARLFYRVRAYQDALESVGVAVRRYFS